MPRKLTVNFGKGYVTRYEPKQIRREELKLSAWKVEKTIRKK